jgi:hypothetical protein
MAACTHKHKHWTAFKSGEIGLVSQVFSAQGVSAMMPEAVVVSYTSKNELVVFCLQRTSEKDKEDEEIDEDEKIYWNMVK